MKKLIKIKSKKIKKQLLIKLITFTTGMLIFNLFLLLSLRYFPKTKAQITEFNFKIKIQGDFNNRKNVSYKTLVYFYTPYEKKYEFKDQEFKLMEGKIFSTKIYIPNFEKNNIYSFFIKPEKYLGRVFSNYIIEKEKNDIDLTADYFYGGDIFPYDGEISAYDLSKIFKNLGKNVNETDLNQDGITNTQDYLMTLYSLKNNLKEDTINLLPKPTPTQTQTPTPTIIQTSTPTQTITQIPTSTNIQTPTPTSTNTPTPTPTSTNTPTPSLTPTVTPTHTPTPIHNSISSTNLDQQNNLCSQIDNGLPNSTIYHPNGTTLLPTTNNRVCSFDLKYYSLPYRNPNCKATEDGIKKAYERMKTFYPRYFHETKLLEQWQIVQKYAEKYNFNPLFVISLWIEESAAGGATHSTQLGCDYRLNKDGTFTRLKASSSICEQMECLFGRRSVVPDNYGLWACQYQHSSRAWENNTCKNTVTFTKVIDFWYNYIGKNLTPDCQIKYYSACQ